MKTVKASPSRGFDLNKFNGLRSGNLRGLDQQATIPDLVRMDCARRGCQRDRFCPSCGCCQACCQAAGRCDLEKPRRRD